MFHKLRNKFLILNMAVTSLVMLTAFSIVYLTTYSNIQEENERRIANVADAVVIGDSQNASLPEVSSPGAGAESGNKIVASSRAPSDYAPSFIVTVDKNGAIATINSFINMSEEIYTEAASAAWSNQNGSTVAIAQCTWMYKIVPLTVTHMKDGQALQTEVTDYYQISFLDITNNQTTLRNLLRTFLFVGIGMLAVIFMVSIFYANRSIRPISQAWEKQKRFIADASHELKTPLTTIMTNCDVLDANKDETVESQKEWLDSIKIGTERMSRLVGSLLTLARVEGMPLQSEKQSFDFGAMVADVARSFDGAAQEKNLQTSQNITVAGEILGYADSVQQVVIILYENAVKYANDGGSVCVSAHRTKYGLACSVKNSGKGIAQSDIPHIFDRFYRADGSRSEDGGNSYGLGLSIAAAQAAQIGGKITVRSEENNFTEFIFTFVI